MPTLEEIDAELARRQSAPAGQPSLADVDAELARRQGGQGMQALSPVRSAITTGIEGAKALGSTVLRMGTPIAATMLAAKYKIPFELAALISGAGAGVGELGAQQVEQPGQTLNLRAAGGAALLQTTGQVAAGELGYGLMRAGGVSQEAAREVANRGPVGGARLAYGAPPPETEAMALSGQIPRLENQPLSPGRQSANAALSAGGQSGVNVPVGPLIRRLRTAVVTPGEAAGGVRRVAQRKLNDLASQIEQEVSGKAGIQLQGPALKAFIQGKRASLPVERFEELFRHEFVEPTVKEAADIEARHNPVFVKALEDIKGQTRQDIAGALERQQPGAGMQFMKGVGEAKYSMSRYEQFRKRLFYREPSGDLAISKNAPVELRTLFTPAGADLRKIIAFYDVETHGNLLSRLHELSLKRELTSADFPILEAIDEGVRTTLGNKFIPRGVLKRGSRAVGKALTVGAPLAGAGAAAAFRQEQP